MSGRSYPAPVPSRSMEVSRISPAPSVSSRRLHSTASSSVALAAAVDHDGEPSLDPLDVDRRHDALAPEALRQPRDEGGIAHGRGIDGDLVGPGPERGTGIGHRADATPDGKRNEDGFGHPADHLQGRLARPPGWPRCRERPARRRRRRRTAAACSTGSPASRSDSKCTPLTTRPPATSRQGMMRRASIPAARRRSSRASASREAAATMSSSARRSRGQAKRARPPPAGEPLEAVVLRSQPHRGVLGHERREHRHQGDLVDPVLIERLHPAQVVQPDRRESGFLLQLRGPQLRPAARPPRCGRAPSPTTPGSGPPAAAPQHQALQCGARSPEDVHVHQGHTNRGHGRHRAKADRSSIPGCWDFSGWNWAPITLPAPPDVGKTPP